MWLMADEQVYRLADALYPPAPDNPGFFLNGMFARLSVSSHSKPL